MAARKAEVIITCDATTVKQVLEGLNNEMKKVNQRRQELQQKQQQGIRLTKSEENELQKLVKYENALAEKQQKTSGEMRKFGEVMKDLSGSKLKDLKRALNEGKRALDNLSANDPNRGRLVTDLKRIQAQIEKNTAGLKSFGSTHNTIWQTAVRNITAYIGVMAGFNKLKSLVEGVFSANMKLSDSLANIRKVSGLSGEAINELYRNISKIDSRNTIETLNQLAYTGAKLGIGQNYGVQGLTGFVKAAEQVQMALGEDMGEKALPELAKMTEVMGLIEKYGVEQSMQKAASAIFQLGATSTATGTNIVEFSKRLYGLANVSRITSDELLAIGSASDAMGLMPEVAATAFNKLFTAVQKNHNMIEKTLNLQPGLIKNYYTQGKTMEAIVAIFEKMNETGNLNLLGSVFKDLGSDGARLVNVMATMSDRVDILKKHLETSRDAFKEGEAVIGEYMIQNQTAQAMLERASNLWAKAFVNPEGVDMVKELAQAWYDVSKALTQSDTMMGSLHTSISQIATALGTLIKLMPVLIRLGLWLGATFGFKAAIAGIGGMITAFRTLYASLLATNGAMGALNVLMKSNVFLFAASAIATAVTLIWDYSKAADEAAKREEERQAKLREAYNKSREAVDNCVKPLESYKRALDEANLSEQQKMQLVKDFKNSYQDYLDYLGIEVNTALDLANAYALVVKVMKQKKAYEERENYRTEVNGENRMNRIAAQAKVEAEARTFGLTGVDKKFLEKNQHLGTNALYKQLIEQKMGTKAYSQSDEDITFLYIDGKLSAPGTQHAPRAKKTYKKVGSEELWKAIDDYITSYRSERDTNKDIDAMWNSEYKDIGLQGFDIDDFNRKVQEARWKRKGTLDREAPDKDALKRQKAEEAARRKALREEMKEEQTQAKAIIDNVKNYYQRQINAVTEMANETGMSKEMQDQLTEGLQQRMNTALANVRKAIGGTENEWEAFKQTMRDDLYEPLNENGENFSTELLDKVMDNNLVKLREMITTLSKELNQQGNVLLDQILRKATENEGKNAKMDNKLMRARNKELLEKNYTGKVDVNYENQMEQFGVAGITQKQSQQIRDYSEKNDSVAIKKFFDERTKLWNDGFKQAREHVLDLMMIDIEAEGGADRMMKLLYGEDYKTALKGTALEGLLSMSADQWKVYYMKLIEYTDAWTDAQRKAYEDQKKRQDYLFKNRPDIRAIDEMAKQLEQRQKNREKSGEAEGGFLQRAGFTAPSEDPELARYMLLEEKAKLYYETMERLRQQDLVSEQMVQDAKNAMIAAQTETQQHLISQLNERMTTLMSWADPIKEFGNEVGQAMYDQWHNGESMTEKWQDMLKKMGLAWGQMTLKIVEELMIQKLKQKIMHKAMQTEETAHQSTMATIEQTGAATREAIADASGAAKVATEQITDKTIEGEQLAHDTTVIAEDQGTAVSENAINTSRAAGKTLADLGWWGIPLVAVIMALLNGLLQAALGTSKSNSDTNTKSSSSSATKTKLVSGMLTYDKGNVQRFIGQDGRVYTATEEPQPKDGLVTRPIATTVQGQPALVAERGPEIVIGRETTEAIMMNEPELIRYIANYDRMGGRYALGALRAYDSGNVSQMADGGSQMADGSPAGNVLDSDTLAALRMLPTVMNALTEQLKKPVYINKYGTGGLIDEVKSGLKFDKRYNG